MAVDAERASGRRAGKAVAGLSLALLALLAGACSADDGGDEASPERPEANDDLATSDLDDQLTTTNASVVELRVAPLTGVAATDPGSLRRPAVVVQVDNSPEARPQFGLADADIVVEVLIENYTRLLAVYHSDGADPVGPVRSARSSDIDILANFGRPLFSHSGSNAGVASELAAARGSGVLVDASVDAEPDEYYRSADHAVPHNLLTTTEGIWSTADLRQLTPPSLFDYDDQPLASAADVGVELQWRGLVSIDYVWDEERGGWLRWQNGSRHADERGQLAPTNVVVLFTEYGVSSADIDSPLALTRGSGDALLLINGEVSEGSWARGTGADDVWAVIDRNGNPVRLLPGSTWIELVEQGDSRLLDAQDVAELN